MSVKKLFKIEMRDKKYLIQAGDRQKAFKKIFKMIVDGEIALDDVSQIMIAKGETRGKDVPMRTMPALYGAGIIDRETALANLREISSDLGEKELEYLKEKDRWLWEND